MTGQYSYITHLGDDRALQSTINLSSMIARHLRIFQRALDLLPLGVTITDAEGTILYVNPADAEMHGYPVEELIGQNARIFAPSRHWRVLTTQEIQMIKVWRRETVNRKKDRTLFPVLLT